jgi:hypothetical protein
VIPLLGFTIVALGLGVTVYAIVRALRGQPLDDPLLFAVAILEVLLLVQLVAGFVLLARDDREFETATFVAYLVGVVLLPPLATFWAIVERSRWGPAVLSLAGVSASVMTLRLLQLWGVVGV